MLRIGQSKAMFRVGLIALLLSALLQIPGRMHPDFHPDLIDGLRGVCLGIFIGAMAATIRRNGRPATS
jgi:hypothetical protein